MKKLVVDKNTCIGCGACAAICPNHFEIDDDGLSKVINEEEIESPEVKEAMDSCPVSAISYVEDEKAA